MSQQLIQVLFDKINKSSEKEILQSYFSIKEVLSDNDSNEFDEKFFDLLIDERYFSAANIIIKGCDDELSKLQRIAIAKHATNKGNDQYTLNQFEASQIIADIVTKDSSNSLANKYFHNISKIQFCDCGPSYGYKLWGFITTLLVQISPKIIVEFGGGRSTLTFADYVAMKGHDYQLFTIEDSPHWASKISWNLQESGISQNTTILYAPLNKNTGWYDISFLNKRVPRQVNLMLIDGPIGDSRNSKVGQEYLLNLMDFSDLDLVIIDDTGREYNHDFSIQVSKTIKDSSILRVKYGWWQKQNIINFVILNKNLEYTLEMANLLQLDYEIV